MVQRRQRCDTERTEGEGRQSKEVVRGRQRGEIERGDRKRRQIEETDKETEKETKRGDRKGRKQER